MMNSDEIGFTWRTIIFNHNSALDFNCIYDLTSPF
jgi:hypothetical protein